MKNEPTNCSHGHNGCGDRKTETCTTCGKKLYGRRDKMYCDITCKNRHYTIARRLKYETFRNHITMVNRNIDILRGIMDRAGHTVVMDVVSLKALKYQMDEVTTARRVGTKWKIFVDGFELEYLGAEKVRITRTMKAIQEEWLKEREDTDYDYGSFYAKWQVEYPNSKNRLDVKWQEALMKDRGHQMKMGEPPFLKKRR